MTSRLLFPKATNPLLLSGEGPGMRSGQFLKAAAISTEKVVEMMKLTKKQIEVTMFAAGVGTMEGLRVGKLVEQSKDV